MKNKSGNVIHILYLELSAYFHFTILPLLHVFDETGMSKQCRPREKAASDLGLHCLPFILQFLEKCTF